MSPDAKANLVALPILFLFGLAAFGSVAGSDFSPSTQAATFSAEEEAQLVPSAYQPGQEIRDCDSCPPLIVVDAGAFTMGSPEDEVSRGNHEGPLHVVQFGRAFAVGKTEVSGAQWQVCVSEGGCSADIAGTPDDRPLANVSWDDAQTFTAWLSAKSGEPYRLLSEAEWEFAARAGASTAFATGDTITPDQANYNGNFSYNGGRQGGFIGKSMPVGSYEPNAYGLHDMHGNVSEWVEDCWRDSYEGAPEDGSAVEEGDACEARVMRGGMFEDTPIAVRAASRLASAPDTRSATLGFRVARSLDVEDGKLIPIAQE